nr:MBL fold metallo-hydrolase [Desulfobacterales bacterium]
MWIKEPGKVTARIELIGSWENSMYLVKGEDIMIIGGGMSFIIPELEKQLNQLEIDPERVKYQLVLHSHFDHCAAVPFCKDRFPNIEILASPISKKILSKQKIIDLIESLNNEAVELMGLNKEYGSAKFKIEAIPIDRVVKEDDVIHLGDGVTVRIIETPGHSKCSIAAYVESEKALFPSDSFPIPVGESPKQLLPMANDNFPQYLESLKRISTLDVEICCLCHRGALTGGEAKEILKEGLKAAESYYKLIIDKYKELGGLENSVPFFAEDITNKLNLGFIKVDLMKSVAQRMIESVIEAEGLR